MPGSVAHLAIGARFQGIPGVALGGYVAGLLAEEWRSAAASFRRPVPLERDLERGELPNGERFLGSGEGALLTVRPTPLDLAVPPPVAVGVAREAARGSPGTRRHLFPQCFTCGPGRGPGDGLRIFVGPVPGARVVAGEWTADAGLAGPDGAVEPRYVWSALDCPSIWALIVAEPPESPSTFVSANLEVHRRRPVPVGEPLVVTAWAIGSEGRTRTGGAAILSRGGEVLAAARHRLVAATWGVPLGRSSWA